MVQNTARDSVWDYPRPPRLENCDKRIQVYVDNILVADSTRTKRVLETSHPPVYYIPPQDVRMEYLETSRHHTFCEWKGAASYYTAKIDPRVIRDAAWYYPQPTDPYAAIKDHLAFYPGKVDRCLVDGEQVRPEANTFYGGWITHNIALR